MTDQPSYADFMTAFDRRLQRRLDEMKDEAQREITQVIVRMNARGVAYSSFCVLEQLDAIKAQLHRAIDWSLGEANRLPGQPFITRQILRPALTARLGKHLDDLYVGIKFQGLLSPMEATVAEHRNQSKQILSGELNDYSQGIWHPRNVSSGVTQMNTNNTVSIHGPQQGLIQQTGAQSNQQATFEFHIEAAQTALQHLFAALETSNIAASARHEIEEEARTIDAQLKRQKPNLGVMQAAVRVIQELAIGIGADMLTPYVIALMQAVGIV
jgi:hypothetical protein